MSKYNCDLNLDDRNSLSVLIKRIKPNSIVLEFGPANGRMTKHMKEQLNCKVYAVEIDENAAKDAEKYAEIVVVDSIENYGWQERFKDLQFDYIVFADVLEHLYYPEKALKSVKNFLKQDGCLLISIPNIAHNSIIINLLKNEFNYNATGLLDNTHIRFFTKKTLDRLVEESGYFKSYESAIFINPENTEFKNSYEELNPDLAEYLKSLSCGEIYQFVYELKKYEVVTISDFSEEYKVYNKNFIQLFLDHGNGLSEENSIKLPVAKNKEAQEFVFDLSHKPTITNLRLDPLNDSCVVEIESLKLLKKNGIEVDLTPYMSTNASTQHHKRHFFDTIDSNCFFTSVDLSDVQKLVVRICYMHTGREALEICMHETKSELHSIYVSRSWKITKSLRKIKYFFNEPNMKFLIRSTYQKLSILRRFRHLLWRIKEKLSLKKHLPTSSSQNKFALVNLAERRFDYTNHFFSGLKNTRDNQAMPNMDISIVTYNSAKWIDQFINSLITQTYPLELINLYFVDNDSKDDTLQKLEEAKLSYGNKFLSWHIIQQRNLGFGAGHDRAIQSSQSELCLITNIDLIFEKDAILNAVRTSLADIDKQYASWEFRQIPYEHPKYYDPITLETNWSSHACILIRRSAYEKVGGYEPKIFMYAEDVELSYRFRAFGYHLKYCPNAVVHHFTYEYENQIKPLQFAGSILGNAYLRLRYGNIKDKLAILPLYFALVVRKERFKGSRKIVIENIKNVFKNINYFSSFVANNPKFYAPFREFDYELIRDGAFYSVELPREKPCVSIIVRTYQGRDQLLKQSLLSIINQTYSNIEIIVVEDGGETMRLILDSLSGIANIHFYALPKVGRSATGNFGLLKSTGSYCLFLDDDDLLFADHIEVLVSSLTKHPNASAAYSLAYLVPTDMNQDKSFYTEEDYTTLKVFYQPFDYNVLCDHNYFPIQSVLFKKDLFLERGGFDESLTYLEDWNLWLRYAYKSIFIYVPKTTSLYRIPSNKKLQHDRHVLLENAYDDAKEKAIKLIKEMKL